MSNIGSYESRRPGFNWSVAEKELGYPENGIYNIAYYCVDRHCDAGTRGEARDDLAGAHGRGQAIHLRRPEDPHECLRDFPAGPRDRARRTDLSLHGQDSRAVHFLPRRAQDGRRRPAPLLRLWRGLALHAARRCEDVGDHHEQEARQEGPPDPRHASVPPPHHRRRRRGDEARGARGRLLVREGPAGRDGSDPPGHARRRRRSCTTRRGRRASRRARSTCTARSSHSS